ncbi:uncharacterized protein LOC141901962 isoform X2 [Tubulanus polymorphus]|uniref:uncharacterized protein LOC141901962 isoform X2 n=1 Tax=Tubulanus polymorphus TaxID=672921 RepID=UPI003DA63048
MIYNINFTSLEIPLTGSESDHAGGGGGYVIPPILLDSSNDSSRPPTPKPDLSKNNSHVLVSVLVPLGCLLLIAFFAFLVIFILKKSRLDKLRHHLMPLYNFDPAEEDGDWESELLEEDKEQQSPSPTAGPKLKFNSDNLDL